MPDKALMRLQITELQNVLYTDGCLQPLQRAFEANAVIIGAVIGAVIVPVVRTPSTNAKEGTYYTCNASEKADHAPNVCQESSFLVHVSDLVECVGKAN